MDIVIIVVGAVVALVAGCVFLTFVYKLIKMRNPRYNQPSEQWKYSTTPSRNKLGTWALIATVVSPILAIVGLGVSVYFGIKPGKS